MQVGDRVEVLRAHNGAAIFETGRIVAKKHTLHASVLSERFDVRLDCGVTAWHCHPASMRSVVAECDE